MRETQFIKQNQEKWSEFEEALDSEHKDADRLRELVVQITDDLSYSRTFYPNRSVRVYLNGLAQRVYLKLYKSRRKPLKQLSTFWSDELPREIYQARQAFRLAFFLFVLCMGIGMLSCHMDPEFAEVVLGDYYVEMTRENIASGDPMAVYKKRGRVDMFLSITLNNIFVAFLAFAMGVFFGLGSVIVLVSNAIMVGCFQYFFIKEGLFWDSFLTIWIHGTLEISAIVIASAAGITMGRGLAFPGTYTRLQSFKVSARRGAKILLGTVPLFVIAGFLEGFLTRQTSTQDIIRGFFILLCLAFVLVYYVWYPWYYNKMKMGGDQPMVSPYERLGASQPYELVTDRIKTGVDLFGEIFVLFRRHSRQLWLAIIGAAWLYTVLVYSISSAEVDEVLPFANTNFVTNIINFVALFSAHEYAWYVPLLGGGMIYATAVASFKSILKEQHKRPGLRNYLQLFVGAALVVCCVGFFSGWVMLPIVFLLPFALLYAYACFSNTEGPFSALGNTSFLLKNNYWRTIGFTLALFLLGALLFSLANSTLAKLLFQVLSWLVSADQVVLDEWSVKINTFILAMIANVILTLLMLGAGLLYYSLREVNEAPGLRARIEQIGKKQRLRGLERE